MDVVSRVYIGCGVKGVDWMRCQGCRLDVVSRV